MLARVARMHARGLSPAWHCSSLTSQRLFSDETEQTRSSWMPNWLKSRLPAFAGGSGGKMQEMDIETYAKTLRYMRRMQNITGSGQGMLRVQEDIIEAMLPEERKDLSSFRAAARQRVAGQVGCTVQQVDDCIAKYLWMQSSVQRLAERQKQGLPMPQNQEEFIEQTGSVPSTRSQHPDMERTAPAGTILVAPGTKEPRTQQPCPLANTYVGRSTRCPLTKRRYKLCCGKEG